MSMDATLLFNSVVCYTSPPLRHELHHYGELIHIQYFPFGNIEEQQCEYKGVCRAFEYNSRALDNADKPPCLFPYCIIYQKMVYNTESSMAPSAAELVCVSRRVVPRCAISGAARMLAHSALEGYHGLPTPTLLEGNWPPCLSHDNQYVCNNGQASEMRAVPLELCDLLVNFGVFN